MAVDVGGEYVPERGRFDHHQRSFCEVRPNGVKYSSFGLMKE
ncbi:MYG1 family protein [Allochromatium tepidum]